MAAKRKLPQKEEMLTTLLEAEEVVVADLETTGFSRNKGAEIIEIGAVRYNFKTGHCKKFHSYVKPAQKIPAKITELTGVTMEMVKDKPYEEVVLRKFYEFIQGRPVVFHNAQFDWLRFLEPGFARIGIHAVNSVICTKILSAWLLPMAGYKGDSYKLCDLCSFFGREIEGAHRADNDAIYTAALLRRLREIGAGMKQQMAVNYRLPEQVRTVSYQDIRINRISPWKKGREERLYISTSVGDVFYDYRKKLWSVQRLAPGKDLDMSGWENFLVHACGIKDLNDWLDDHHPT